MQKTGCDSHLNKKKNIYFTFNSVLLFSFEKGTTSIRKESCILCFLGLCVECISHEINKSLVPYSCVSLNCLNIQS